MFTRKDVVVAVKMLRGEMNLGDTSAARLQLARSLLVYKNRCEWDGSIEDAIRWLREAEYEIDSCTDYRTCPVPHVYHPHCESCQNVSKELDNAPGASV